MKLLNFKHMRRMALTTAALISAAVMALAAFPAKALAVEVITSAFTDKQPSFIAFTGVIIEIREYSGDATRSFIMVEDDNEAVVNFVSTTDTYYPEGTELAVGMTVTGYYDALRPMLMIYPPQPDAAAFWVNAEDEIGFAKVERFDENLLSYDGVLKLNIGDETEIINQDGTPFEALTGKTKAESLANKALMVFYSVTTRSIPAQTPPTLVVVLTSVTTPEIEPHAPTETPAAAILPEAGTPVALVVAGVASTSIPLTLNNDDTIMVPLYLVCPILGMDLAWDGDARAVTIDGAVTIIMDSDAYAAPNGLTLSLGAPPVIIDDRAYVPLSFFRDVLGLNNAYFLEGQIVIDDFEKME